MVAKRCTFVVGIGLLLAGCDGAEAPEAAPPTATPPPAPSPTPGLPETDPATWTVDFDRYGPILLGLPFDSANHLAGGRLGAPDPEAHCDMVRVSEVPDRVWVMVVAGRVVRVDVEAEAVTTARGAGVGDSEDRIRELYPEGVRVEPHHYTDGHYLVVFAPADTTRRLIFETDGEDVQNFRAGEMPPVSWVEGCS